MSSLYLLQNTFYFLGKLNKFLLWLMFSILISSSTEQLPEQSWSSPVTFHQPMPVQQGHYVCLKVVHQPVQQEDQDNITTNNLPPYLLSLA